MSTATQEQFGKVISESSFIERGLFFKSKVSKVRLHERGVVISQPKRTTQIPFRDVAAFSVGKLSMYLNGSGQGLRYFWEIARHHPSDSKPTKFTFWMRGIWVPGQTFFGFKTILGLPIKYLPFNGNMVNPTHDETLEQLRIILTQQVARQLYEKFKMGESVEWTPNVFLSRTGIHSNQEGSHWVPFDKITDTQFDDGDLVIKTSLPGLPSLKLMSGRTNYYPGLRLFRWAMSALDPSTVSA